MKVDLFDVPVFYISLETNTEQHKYVEGFLTQKGFRSVTRLPGVISDTKRMGVALAHKNALENCLSAVEGHFIILEGDVAPWAFQKQVEIPDNTDALYLGASRWGLKDGHGVKSVAVTEHSEQLYRVWNMLAAHAILYTKHEYAEFLINAIDVMIGMGTNQDKARAETQKYWNIYATKMPMFFQTGVYMKDTRVELPGPTNKPLSWFYQ
jgi:hypothetical protein